MSRPWWETSVIYQIYPRSFKDSTGDGVGDLNGIRQKLPYLESLGVDALWISPFYKSPMVDFGYDVADYTAVDPLFGTMADFDALLAEVHAAGLRIIIDFVPNHTSDQHPWFVESRSSRDNPKRDWYIWRDPQPDGSPPNNVVGFFEGSIWTLDETTGQYYLHMFLEEQPDLNWRNPEVAAAMYDVMRFWLDKGVDGFRLDAITVLIKAEPMRDLPEHALSLTSVPLLRELVDVHNQPEMHQFMNMFRQIVDSYEHDPVLVGETYTIDLPDLMTFYGDNLDEIHLPMNLAVTGLPWEADVIRDFMRAYYNTLPAGAVPSFAFGNHDRSRIASRFGPENVRSVMMLLLTLWGVPTLYNGDELGMTDGTILPHQRQDPFVGEDDNIGMGRDPLRTPIQWDGSSTAGFTDEGVEPWLPVHTTFTSHVAAQDADPTSTLSFTRRLLALRREHRPLHAGAIRFVGDDPDVLIYERTERIRVLINVSANERPVEEAGEVLLSTYMDGGAGDTLRPHEGLIQAMR